MELEVEQTSDGCFVIQLKLGRSDIEKLGFDTSQLTDGDLEYMVMRIRDDFVRQMCSSALRDTIEYYMKHKQSL